MTLPLFYDQHALAMLAFLGGLSAATGMVIVEAIAVSTMVCNDLVMPVLLRTRRLAQRSGESLTGWLLGIRRVAILVLLLLGYTYFHLAGEAYALVSIGLISFAAVAQFAPAVLGAMYWKGGTRNGVLAGLLLGFALWAYTLMVRCIEVRLVVVRLFARWSFGSALAAARAAVWPQRAGWSDPLTVLGC